jgi:transposase
MWYTCNMPNKSNPLTITVDQRQTLETWIRAHNTPQSIVLRARIILLAVDGLSNVKIAQEAHVTRVTVILWRKRFMAGGPEALTMISPGRGHPVTYTAEKVRSIVEATTQTKPLAATHWSTRSMAKAQGISKATVQRIWSAHGLQPHRIQSFI